MNHLDRFIRWANAGPAFAAAAILAVGSLAQAAGAEAETHADKGTRFYVSGLVGGSWATGDAKGTTLGDGKLGGSSSDETPFGGGAAGVVFDLGWSDLRLELEGTGGRSFTFTTPALTGTYVTNVSLWTLQGNFWFEYGFDRIFPDVPVVRALSAFGGGGIGLSQLSLATSNGVSAGSGDSSELAWQAGAGLAYRVNPWLSLETRYQYADLGGPSVAVATGGVPQGDVGVDIGTQEVVGAVRFILPHH